MRRVVRWLVTALGVSLMAAVASVALASAQGGGVAESGCVSAVTRYGNEVVCYGGADDAFTSLKQPLEYLEGRGASFAFVPAGDLPGGPSAGAPAEPRYRYVIWQPEGENPTYERIRKQTADGPEVGGNWQLLELPPVCDAEDVLYGWGLAPLIDSVTGEWDYDNSPDWTSAFQDFDYLSGNKVSCIVDVEPNNWANYDWYQLVPNDDGDYRFAWE